jgi:hypothetical protein
MLVTYTHLQSSCTGLLDILLLTVAALGRSTCSQVASFSVCQQLLGFTSFIRHLLAAFRTGV